MSAFVNYITNKTQYNAINQHVFLGGGSVGKCKRILHIYKNKNKNQELYQRMLQLLAIPKDSEGTEIMHRFFEQMMKDIDEKNATDDFIYNSLKSVYQDIVKKKGKVDYNTIRLTRRADDVIRILKEYDGNILINRMLDVGCSDGTMTASIGKVLNLEKDDVHGCDILDLEEGKQSDDMIYTKMTNVDKLPYKDGMFDLVTIFMAMHHFIKLHDMIGEIRRVLKPNGLLIFREHDCPDKDFSYLLDIQHGLYVVMRGENTEMQSFCSYYYAKYHSMKKWRKILGRYNFKQMKNSPDKNKLNTTGKKITRMIGLQNMVFGNVDNHYYGFYQKQ